MTDIVLGIRLTADGKGLVGEVKLSREELEKLTKTAKEANAAARSGADDNRRYAESLQSIGRFGAVAGAAIVALAGALALKVKSTTEAAAALHRMSEQTGRSVDWLQRMKYAEDQLGISNGALVQSYQQLPRTIVEAIGPQSEAGRALKALGIDPKQIRDTEQGMALIAERVSQVSDPMVQAALATMIFKQRGEELMPYLRQGPEGMRRLYEEGGKYAHITTEGARQAEELRRQWSQLEQSGGALSRMIQSDLLPWLNRMVGEFIEGQRQAGGFFEAVRLFGGMSPFRTPTEGIAHFQGVIDEAERNPSRLGLADAADARKRIEFLKWQQRREDLAAYNANPFKEDDIVGSGNVNGTTLASLGREPRAPQTGADMADYVRQLREQVQITKESTTEEKVLFELREKHWKNATPALREQAAEYARQLDLKKQQQLAFEAEIARTREQSEEDSVRVRLGERANQLRNQALDQSRQTVQSANDELAIAQKEIELMGLAEPARRELIALFRAEIESRKQINDLTRQGVPLSAQDAGSIEDRNREAARAGAQAQQIRDQLQDAKRYNEEVGRSLTDALMRGFEAGKDFGRNFRDSLVNMFKTLVIRPIIQPIVTSAAGAVTGVLGFPGAASASAGGGLGGLSNGLSLANTASGLLGGGWLSGTAAYSAATGAGASQAAMLAAQTGVFGAEGLAATAGMEAAGVGAAGMAATAIPYVALAIMAYQMLKTKKTPAYGTGYSLSGAASTAGFGGAILGDTNKGAEMLADQSGWTQEFNNRLAAQLDAIKAAGYDPSTLAGRSYGVSMSGAFNGGDPRATIDAAVADVAGRMALDLVPALKDFRQEGETLVQALLRMVQAEKELTAAQEQAQSQLAGMVRNLPGQLGITGLEQYRASLSVDASVAPLERVAAARALFESTRGQALGGDLSAVQGFPGAAQQLLGIGRDVFASGPQFAELFKEVNRSLNDVLGRQQELQTELLADVPMAVRETSQDQISELRKGFTAVVAQLKAVEDQVAQLRRAA